MNSTFRIRVLIDNTVHRRGLTAEHGWCVWIETPEGGILFDTGQTDLLLRNAQALGVPLETARYIVISHGSSTSSRGCRCRHCWGACIWGRPVPNDWQTPWMF